MWSEGLIKKPGPKIIKLKLETRLKSQASDWLKWRLVSNLSFMILGPEIMLLFDEIQISVPIVLLVESSIAYMMITVFHLHGPIV
jgi:hypothetical protein